LDRGSVLPRGRRFTINNVNYVKTGSVLVPAAMTPSAKYASFGFKNSNLRILQWRRLLGISFLRISPVYLSTIFERVAQMLLSGS
jgi:hypothetical protein